MKVFVTLDMGTEQNPYSAELSAMAHTLKTTEYYLIVYFGSTDKIKNDFQQ